VLELTDRLGAPSTVPAGAPSAPLPGAMPLWHDQVVEALVGLGWSAKQAGDAVDAVTAGTDGADGAAGAGGVAGVLRSALRHLGRAG
jgi:Holliday junction DNA helicase RuvA